MHPSPWQCTFTMLYISNISMTRSKSTCSQILYLPELEYGPIEDWHKYEHAPCGQVIKSSQRMPDGALELHTSWTRVCIEISLVVSEEHKKLIQESKM